MDVSLDDIAALITGTLPAQREAAVRATVMASSDARGIFERLSLAATTLQDDGRDPVPAVVVAAARELSTRLDRYRTPSLLDQAAASLGAIAGAIRAHLVFDSRLQGSLAGLRGGTGFAVTYAIDGIDVDIECTTAGGDVFEVIGQLATADESSFGPGSVTFTETNGSDPRAITVPIDSDSMFRARLTAGTYSVQFVSANSKRRGFYAMPLEIP
ncbi:MAG: hypothetical protein SGJ11_16410 [Phycisphaerae bacterium]|nr:hypothetical protein [Phycisphaerae bacterium]